MTPQPALFRQEAVEFQRHQRQWGDVTLLQPPSNAILFWFTLAAVALILGFLLLAQYARKETVSGFLTPTAGSAKIFVPQQGTIHAIHVEPGQDVEQGQPLLTVTTGQIAADGQDVNAAILQTLAQQRASLARQMEAEGERATSERNRLGALIRGLETEIAHLDVQAAIQRQRIRLSEELVAAANRLSSQGYISEIEQKRRQEGLLEQRQQLSSLGQQAVARQNQLTETRFALEQLPVVAAERIQLLRNELSAVDQRSAEANGRRAYILRAPAAGRVSVLQATLGQTVTPQRPALQIVPRHSVLQAELFVPTRAVGFVRVGQDVRLLYDAFPYQNFGTYHGRIVRISQSILTGSELAAPVELREPAYKVTVALDRQDIDAYGQKLPLQADMLLRADIVLDRRPLVTWLLEPLLAARVGR